ncbi:flagellar motor switch phosphatase FliY [Planococcus lenghuensis]|uniref:Flagellar motor switch protein FliN n=1 Tax=Planococcus lenghuensis TaxID=2213202 RepID=A0A1Q2L131_9BACL|nr:flagellar motor switch phosphatase FliY [Planococcus lenghuensis]AQQ54123.1 flagellar motor switch protein FliN [Planococcus lenghuensis]
MTNEKLSPDEMNGLLGRKGKPEAANGPDTLNATEQEIVKETFCVALGSAARPFTRLFGDQVLITAPELAVKRTADMFQEASVPYFVVLSDYSEFLEGVQLLTVSQADGRAMAEIMNDGDSEDPAVQLETVQTAVKMAFDAVAHSLSALLEQEVAHSLSGVDLVTEPGTFQAANFIKEDGAVEFKFQAKVGSRQNLNFHFCLPVRLAKQLAAVLDDSADEDMQEETQTMPFQSDNQSNGSNPQPKPGGTPNVQSVQFASFDDEAPNQSEPNNLDMLLDVPLQVTVELGRTKRMVKEILGISQGSILELDKLAGEPVDILVNNKLIAVGEVVVIDENFGVRVTDILSAADRISKLR